MKKGESIMKFLVLNQPKSETPNWACLAKLVCEYKINYCITLTDK